MGMGMPDGICRAGHVDVDVDVDVELDLDLDVMQLMFCLQALCVRLSVHGMSWTFQLSMKHLKECSLENITCIA
jgi:hypothetical protein